MKELSVEEKAKRFDEVVNEIRNLRDMLLEEGVIKEDGVICDNFNRIFPELAEPEDEKIRKAIIEFIKVSKPEWENYSDYSSWIDWLEKQKVTTSSKDIEKMRNAAISACQYMVDNFENSTKQYEDAITWLEKQVTSQTRTGDEWVNTIDDACDKRYSEEYAHGEYCHEQSFKWGFQEGVEWLEKQDKKVEPIEGFDTEFERQISQLIASTINKEYEYTEAFIKWTSDALLNYAKHEIENRNEQKSKKVSLWKHWKNGIAGNGEGKLIYLVKEGNTYSLSSCLGFECDYIELSELDNLMLEKQDEQKQDVSAQINLNPSEYINDMGGNGCYLKNTAQNPVEWFEPKFKDGDWVTDDGETVFHITIDKNMYQLETVEGTSCHFSYECIEERYRLWTIQDAKDGDVLKYTDTFNRDWIFVYKYKSFDSHTIDHYSLIIERDFFPGGSLDIDIECVEPATKEQRDLLFQKMKEAGYRWDEEKLELKKIEQKQKPAWNEIDTALVEKA